MKKCLLPVLIFLCWQLPGSDRLTGRITSGRSEVIACRGMVAASQPLAAQVGIDILKKGGSAVDAAIAVNAALGLMEPSGAGIGGDLFAIVWDSKVGEALRPERQRPGSGGRLARLFPGEADQPACRRTALCPGPSPAASTAGSPCTSVSVGCRMARCPRPGHRLRRGGVPALGADRPLLAARAEKLRRLRQFPETLRPGRQGAAKRRHLPQPRARRHLPPPGAPTAATPSTAASSPPRIVAYSRKVGGFFALDDFAAFQPEWVDADERHLPRLRRLGAAAERPGAGGPADAADAGRASTSRPWATTRPTICIPSSRSRRSSTRTGRAITPIRASPPWTTPRSSRPDYAGKRLELFDAEQANRSIPAGDPRLAKGDTVYLTVVDKDFNAVSLIQSNYRRLRLGHGPGRTGILPAGPRRPVQPGGRAPQQHRSRQASFPHDHSRLCHPGRPSRCSPSASWAATCSRRGTCRYCATSSTSA